jgi:hypothetical protein
MKWQQPELATTINQTRSVLCECIGTRRELTDEIEATYPYFVYHSWINAVDKQQRRLDVQM